MLNRQYTVCVCISLICGLSERQNDAKLQKSADKMLLLSPK